MPTPSPAPSPPLEVVIVGAGLAGLRAAWALRGRALRVLEREPAPGGRVRTVHLGGQPVDLGACFALPPQRLPLPWEAGPWLPGTGPIGLLAGGALRWGPDPAGCLAAAFPDPAGLAALSRWAREPGRPLEDLPQPLQGALEAFFQVVHPGPLGEALPARQRDALVRWRTGRHARGNGAAVEALAAPLGARLRTGAEVTRIEPGPDQVLVGWREGGRLHEVQAQAVICALPPGPAGRALGPGPWTPALEAVGGRAGASVALAFRGAPAAPFAYVAAPGPGGGAVILQPTPDPELTVLLCLLPGPPGPGGEAEDRRRARALLARIGPPVDPGRPPDWEAAARWPSLGPAITEAGRALWSPAQARPHPRLWLAGDHTWWEGPAPMPYGVAAALGSGARAGEEAARFLDGAGPRAPRRPAGPPPLPALTDLSVFSFQDRQPRFQGRAPQGDLAWHGLLLEADPCPTLRDRLLAASEEGLWEYSPGLGPTPEDSALVLEGLLAAFGRLGGDAPALLEPSARRLVERFYLPEPGAFQTVIRGRAAYWAGPSVDATAQAGAALAGIRGADEGGRLARCARWLGAAQEADGGWRGRWYPSRQVTTFHVIRFLTRLGPGLAGDPLLPDRLGRAAAFLRGGQGPDGSWGGSVIDTAAALRALARLQLAPAAVARGAAWLEGRRGAGGGWPGEPVLYYAMELEGDPDLRFALGIDRGPVTSAWARLALAEAGADPRAGPGPGPRAG